MVANIVGSTEAGAPSGIEHTATGESGELIDVTYLKVGSSHRRPA